MVSRETKKGRVSWLHRGVGAEDIREREGAVHVGVMLGRWTAVAGRHRQRGRLLSLAQCARERGRWLVA
jgi:hypothetical protein